MIRERHLQLKANSGLLENILKNCTIAKLFSCQMQQILPSFDSIIIRFFVLSLLMQHNEH